MSETLLAVADLPGRTGIIGAYDARLEHLLIGHSVAMRRVRCLVGKLARTALPVLIHGPTGAGKEVVARAIHAASDRSGRLVACNVCAIADGLFEAAMFGHSRGAFTGAIADSAGMLLEAHGGTVFLDEIGGLALASQAKLLRAIESREFRPVGGRADRRSEFRLVTATNEDLEARVADGRFRSDLLYRLTGAVIEVPPLSARLEDIPLLARHFLPEHSISAGALALLADQPWPGNVRELRAVVECAVALAERDEVTRSTISDALALRGLARSTVRSRQDAKTDELVAALAAHDGDVEATAVALGVHRATIYRRLRRLGG